MKILFDFERFDNPNVDTHLSDIMLAVKAECNCLLKQYHQRISADGGLVLVTLRPGKIAFQYHYSSDTVTFAEVQTALERFDWDAVIERYARLGQN